MDLVTLLISTFALTMIGDGKRLWTEDDINIGYDFETLQDLSYIQNKNKKEIGLDTTLHKHGKHSLLWQWNTGKPITFDLKPQLSNLKSKRRFCGIHFWLHQNIPVNTHLLVTYHNELDGKFSFRINLNFKNWRAVSRTFAITKSKIFKGTTKVSLEVEDNNPYVQYGRINIDLIRISSRCVGWGYDFINTPQIPLTFGRRNEIGGIENLNGVYERNHFWQAMYKWRKIDVYHNNMIDDKSSLTKEEKKLTKELIKIEKRVDNWYFPEDESFETLDEISKSRFKSLQDCELRGIDKKSKQFRKWIDDLRNGNFAHKRRTIFASKDAHHQVCFKSAYQKLSELTDPETGQWPHLFPSRDVLPNAHDNMTGLKFNEINHHILFPLSLEYFISKRKSQRKQKLTLGSESRDKMEEILKDELKYEPELLNNANEQKTIYKTFKAIDNRRFKTFTMLYQYLISEGWTDGSGLGNTDHLLNLNMGFTQSLYLLRKDLKNYKMFPKLINTARWYNEIGELNQDDYPHNGTTADKIKGAMLGRLLTILASPYGSIKETRQKIRDAKNLKRWLENALEINEGYGGIFKPDFIGYHHKGPYLSAYIPNALQALSLVAYFLEGTSFAISHRHLENLRNALKTMYLMSNSHLIPLSVSGAKVAKKNTAINLILPAFGYLALALRKDFASVDSDVASIFLQLYEKSNPFVQKNLVEGKLIEAATYLNSVGAITVFEKVLKLAAKNKIKPATLPNGNWAKNYAAISIHRRDEWAVTAKGFSKYIWDYESLVDQNIYGRYQSHGQIEIQNRRNSFDASDIFSGWDWNKVPGATTVDLRLDELRSADKSRYFSNSTIVGGLSSGKKRAKNGIFVMDFKQPKYLDLFYQNNPYSFSFKKSYFFINDMIICLGSNIQKSGLQNRQVITTLFQNKLKGQATVNFESKEYTRRDRINVQFKDQPITVLDVNNNGYFIPSHKENEIQLKIDKNLDSKKPNGMSVDHRKVYASVTINHGAEPQNHKYEYVILVNSGHDRLNLFKYQMEPENLGRRPYTVQQQNEIAHIIQIQNKDNVVTGYTIFDSERFLGETDEHFIRKVNRPCVVMVKETQKEITLDIMDPDLRLFNEYINNSKSINEKMLHHTKSKEAWLEITFNQDVEMITRKNKNSNLRKSVSKVYYKANEFGDVRPMIKMLMSHGTTTEIKFRRKF